MTATANAMLHAHNDVFALILDQAFIARAGYVSRGGGELLAVDFQLFQFLFQGLFTGAQLGDLFLGQLADLSGSLVPTGNILLCSFSIAQKSKYLAFVPLHRGVPPRRGES